MIKRQYIPLDALEFTGTKSKGVPRTRGVSQLRYNVQYSIRRIRREEKENSSILNAGILSIRTVFERRRHLIALRRSESDVKVKAPP